MTGLGRKLKLAGIVFFVIWVSIVILLSLLRLSVNANLNTVIILFGIGIIALGYILDWLSEAKV
jgi:hypothetical protein